MKLSKHYFTQLTPSAYRDYLKLLPPIKREHTKTIIMLIFTFFALSFLGLFAINPTIATIINLQKQIKDNEFVLEQLTTKTNNLSQLQQQYSLLTNDLPIIYAAIPDQPMIPMLIGQIQTLVKQNNLSLVFFRIPNASLSENIKTQDSTASSFALEIETQGSYINSMNFLTTISTMNRIVVIEKITMRKDEKQNNIIVQIQARAYSKQ